MKKGTVKEEGEKSEWKQRKARKKRVKKIIAYRLTVRE